MKNSTISRFVASWSLLVYSTNHSTLISSPRFKLNALKGILTLSLMFLDPVDNDAHHGKFVESTSFNVGVSWTENFEIMI